MTLTISPTQRTDAAAIDRPEAGGVGNTTPAAITTNERLVTSFGSTVQALFAPFGRSDTVRAVVDLAVSTFGGAVGVVLLTTELQPMSAAASSADAASADDLQLSLRQGPVLQSIDRRQPVLVSELRSDSRWRFWAPVAADLGFRSAMVLPLADGDVVGSLSLYSRSASVFDSADLVPGMTFAQVASIAIAVAQEREQLLRAVKSRSVVGQAQGVLMELYGVTGMQALTVLTRYSTQLDLDLAAMAEAVIRDRGLPDTGSLEPGAAVIRKDRA